MQQIPSSVKPIWGPPTNQSSWGNNSKGSLSAENATPTKQFSPLSTSIIDSNEIQVNSVGELFSPWFMVRMIFKILSNLFTGKLNVIRLQSNTGENPIQFSKTIIKNIKMSYPVTRDQKAQVIEELDKRMNLTEDQKKSISNQIDSFTRTLPSSNPEKI